MMVKGMTLPQLLWCYVPAGEFIMGSDKNYDDEKPQHTLTLPDFYMSRYLVTYQQYQAFENAPDFADERWWVGFPEGEKHKKYDQEFQFANHPCETVTWYCAMAFGRWMTYHTEKLQLPLLVWDNTAREIIEAPYQHMKITLPSEAEYEKMARGEQGLIYPYGNDFDPNKANTFVTALKMTSAVGVFPAGESPYGVSDASGNVWTWTRSIYKNYKYDNNDGREDKKDDMRSIRSLRGGCWFTVEDRVRASYRYDSDPFNADDFIGFFVVCRPY
jgi:formylglycine-generating enzyme required for sulfatase activity